MHPARRLLQTSRTFPWKVVAMFAGMAMLGWTGVGAQSDKWVKRGQDALAERAYLEAIEYFEWSLRSDTTAAAAAGLGECYHALGDLQRSAQWWGVAASRPPVHPRYAYQMGRALLAMNDPDSAAVWFARYYELAPGDALAQAYRNMGQWRTSLSADSSLYKISRLRINSKEDDFGAAWYPKGMLFCSNRPSDVAVVNSSASTGLPLSDVYFCAYDSAKGWQRPKSMPALNTRANEGPMAYDSRRSRLYLTRNVKGQAEKGPKGPAQLGIVAYDIQDGKFAPGKSLPLRDRASYAHPALTHDGRRLYFASDRAGGMGGTDIWYLEARDDDWTGPYNAGPSINTSENEGYPAFLADGTLYFSSEGHPGMGGMDIFFSRPDGSGGWHKPLNLGLPVNSHRDDFGFMPNADGSEGLFTTNRNAGSGDDLYSFTRNRPSFECQPQVRNNYCFRFWETGSMETDTLPLIYVWDMGDGNLHKGLEVNHCYAGPGNYLVQLNLIDSISGFVFLNEVTYEMNITDAPQAFIDAPDTVQIGVPVTFDGTKSNPIGCTPKKYFWEFGDGAFTSGDRVTHAYDRTGTYEVKLGVRGDQTESSAPCQSCVTRAILVLEPARLEAIRDSVARANEANPFSVAPIVAPPPTALDSVGKEVRDIRDSTGLKFRVQLRESESPLDPKGPEFKNLPNVTEYQVGSVYKYTYGEEGTRSEIFPYYKEAQERGFMDALVVAFNNKTAVSGSDSSITLRFPAKFDGERVVLFSGEIRDAEGKPLMAELSIEDLMTKVEIVRMETDSGGAFRLRLPDGRLYGYYVEAEGHFPHSDYLDLRTKGGSTHKEVVIQEPITMSTIEEIVDRGVAVRVNNIFFDHDSDRIRPESHTVLALLMDMLRQNPSITVEILGHTDSDGEDLYNLNLSQRRADAVARYIHANGFEYQVLHTIGYGEIMPVAKNDTPEGRQQNRRVEFRLLRR